MRDSFRACHHIDVASAVKFSYTYFSLLLAPVFHFLENLNTLIQDARYGTTSILRDAPRMGKGGRRWRGFGRRSHIRFRSSFHQFRRSRGSSSSSNSPHQGHSKVYPDSETRIAIFHTELPASTIAGTKKAASHCLVGYVYYSISISQPSKANNKLTTDGLRGIASLLVVFHHASLLGFSWEIHDGWSPTRHQIAWFIRLPIIRLLISGPPQVDMFFVVSGYAISHKALKLSHQGRFAEAGSSLYSSVFRRHPRLFCKCSTWGRRHHLPTNNNTASN